MEHEMKKISLSRAEDIINTSNPKFQKYYVINIDDILFWISDKPYRKYKVILDGWSDEVKVQHIKYLEELFEKHNFKRVNS
jgi:predicted AAA+ superfamily ATPase